MIYFGLWKRTGFFFHVARIEVASQPGTPEVDGRIPQSREGGGAGQPGTPELEGSIPQSREGCIMYLDEVGEVECLTWRRSGW